MQGVAGSWTSDPNGPSLSFRYRNSQSKPGFMTSYVWETRKAVGTGGVTAFSLRSGRSGTKSLTQHVQVSMNDIPHTRRTFNHNGIIRSDNSGACPTAC